MSDPGDEHHRRPAVTDNGFRREPKDDRDLYINADHLLEWLRSGRGQFQKLLSFPSSSRYLWTHWDDKVRVALERWDEADDQGIDRERAVKGNALADLLRSTLPEEK